MEKYPSRSWALQPAVRHSCAHTTAGPGLGHMRPSHCGPGLGAYLTRTGGLWGAGWRSARGSPTLRGHQRPSPNTLSTNGSLTNLRQWGRRAKPSRRGVWLLPSSCKEEECHSECFTPKRTGNSEKRVTNQTKETRATPHSPASPSWAPHADQRSRPQLGQPATRRRSAPVPRHGAGPAKAYQDGEARPAQPHYLPTRLRQRRSRPVGHGASRHRSPAEHGARRRGEPGAWRREAAQSSPLPLCPLRAPGPATSPAQGRGGGGALRDEQCPRPAPAPFPPPVRSRRGGGSPPAWKPPPPWRRREGLRAEEKAPRALPGRGAALHACCLGLSQAWGLSVRAARRSEASPRSPDRDFNRETIVLAHSMLLL